ALRAFRRLEPAQASRMVMPVLERETGLPLGELLSNRTTARWSPDEKSRFLRDAARTIEQLLDKESNVRNQANLAYDMAVVATRLDANESAEVLRKTAKVLARSLEKESNEPDAYLASALAEVTGQLNSAEAASICVPVIEMLERATYVTADRWRIRTL